MALGGLQSKSVSQPKQARLAAARKIFRIESPHDWPVAPGTGFAFVADEEMFQQRVNFLVLVAAEF